MNAFEIPQIKKRRQSVQINSDNIGLNITKNYNKVNIIDNSKKYYSSSKKLHEKILNKQSNSLKKKPKQNQVEKSLIFTSKHDISNSFIDVKKTKTQKFSMKFKFNLINDNKNPKKK